MKKVAHVIKIKRIQDMKFGENLRQAREEWGE